jgi:cell wall-associated NlpC family hydrolase
VARELGFPEAESLYARVANYSPTRPVPSALLKEGFAAIYDRVASIEDARPGDVLLLKVGGRASHIAIVSEEGRAIHAQIGPKDWVKETRLEALTRMFPVDSIWRWRDER